MPLANGPGRYRSSSSAPEPAPLNHRAARSRARSSGAASGLGPGCSPAARFTGKRARRDARSRAASVAETTTMEGLGSFTTWISPGRGERLDKVRLSSATLATDSGEDAFSPFASTSRSTGSKPDPATPAPGSTGIPSSTGSTSSASSVALTSFADRLLLFAAGSELWGMVGVVCALASASARAASDGSPTGLTGFSRKAATPTEFTRFAEGFPRSATISRRRFRRSSSASSSWRMDDNMVQF